MRGIRSVAAVILLALQLRRKVYRNALGVLAAGADSPYTQNMQAAKGPRNTWGPLALKDVFILVSVWIWPAAMKTWMIIYCNAVLSPFLCEKQSSQTCKVVVVVVVVVVLRTQFCVGPPEVYGPCLDKFPSSPLISSVSHLDNNIWQQFFYVSNGYIQYKTVLNISVWTARFCLKSSIVTAIGRV